MNPCFFSLISYNFKYREEDFMDLFTMSMEKNLDRTGPLADRLRPKKLKDFVGQKHLVDEGKFLQRSIKSDRITSMIFFGPPGTGKTTLAMIIANSTSMNFEKLSAVTAGVKDIREVVEKAENSLKHYNKKTILFVDEIHRFNKSQQDALLPFVERGIIILIGATTENPYFEVNKALLSRVMVLELKSLNRDDLSDLIDRALSDRENGLGAMKIDLKEEAREFIIRVCDGDGRNILNSLEIAALSTEKNSEGIIVLDIDNVSESIQRKALKYDKDGDEHYNTISAFIKSMRGSDENAAVYWLAKMIDAGEDPKFIARRILIFASEDVGLADSNAITLANSTFQAVNVIGMPESRIILSQAVIYMAKAPKSNSAYLAIDRALGDIRNEKTMEIPNHLKDSHYKGAEKLGHGKGYKYPHDYGGYVEQDYLPVEYRDKKYYEATNNGDDLDNIKK